MPTDNKTFDDRHWGCQRRQRLVLNSDTSSAGVVSAAATSQKDRPIGNVSHGVDVRSLSP